MCGHKIRVQNLYTETYKQNILKTLNSHNLAGQCPIIKNDVASESVQKTESDSNKKLGVHKRALGT